MIIMLNIVWLEFENFIYKKSIWLLMSIYTIFTFIVCLFSNLRQSYFTGIESVPIMLFNFIVPIFLIIILTSTLSPVFVEDKETNFNQIPAACLFGRNKRSIAKMLAAIFFDIFICFIIAFITFIIPLLFNLFDENLIIKYVGSTLHLNPIWSVWQHFLFSFICLIIACIILTLLLLLISCNARTTINAISMSTIFVIFEFLFNNFSFPTIIQEYNVWVFFEPYYFFVMKSFNLSPYFNLLLLSTAFLPLCIFAIWQIIKKAV